MAITTSEHSIGTTQLTRFEPRVADDDPWHDDKLQRKRAADALAKLIKTQTRPFVVALNGEWGTGKTFFLERWQKQMATELGSDNVIYYNAWKDDFFDDPLVPLLSSIMRSVKDDELHKKVSESFKELAYRNAQSLTAKFTGIVLPEFGDSVLQVYEDQTKTMTRLRDALTDLVNKRQSKNNPLVLIVDELDRCRPDFAVATLERTKHVFDIPGLVFIYGINRHQLCKSIASLYGDIDAEEYIRRFFDIDFMLPSVNAHGYASYLADHYAISSNMVRAKLRDGNYFAKAVSSLLGSLSNLSLRDIEQCTRIAAFVAINMADGKTPFHYHTIIAVIVTKIIWNDLYQRFVRGDHVARQMIDLLSQHAMRDISWLKHVQGPLYAISDERTPAGSPTAQHELQVLVDDPAKESTLLADWTRRMKPQDIEHVLERTREWHSRDLTDVKGGIRNVDNWHSQLIALIELAAGR